MRLSYFSRDVIPRPAPSTAQLINIHDIRVASPCLMPWEAMHGNELVRHCDDCKLNVYNLSAMSEAEIQRLLARQEGQRVCVRFYRRADGTMLTQDCPRGLRRIAKRVSKVGAALLSAMVSMNFAAAKTRTQPQACQRVQTQETSANMVIVISDPDGAVVAGAKVAIVDQSGKVRFSGKTDGAGALARNDLPAGDYTLKVTVRGFKETNDAVHLEQGKNVQVKLKLALAGTSSTIEVTANTLGVVDMGALAAVTNSNNHTAPVPAGRPQPGLMRQ